MPFNFNFSKCLSQVLLDYDGNFYEHVTWAVLTVMALYFGVWSPGTQLLIQ